MKIHVRPATPGDIDWLMSQLKEFARFFGTLRSLFGDEAYVREVLPKMMAEPNLMLIAENTDVGPVGFIAGLVSPHIFNPSITVLCETFWWVDERFRGTRAGLLLLEAFTKWGEANVDWIMFTLEHHSPVKDACLTKRGFNLQERNFLKEIV